MRETLYLPNPPVCPPTVPLNLVGTYIIIGIKQVDIYDIFDHSLMMYCILSFDIRILINLHWL